MSRRSTRKSKESGGAIGLTENPQMLERWMVAGPELCRVVEEFEGVQNELGELPHHQEGRASRRRFLSHVRDVINVILMNGNPFEKQLRGLVSLGDTDCEFPTSAHSVYFIESTWKEQFKNYQESIRHSSKIALTAPIKRSKQRRKQMYKDTKVKRKSAMKLKVDHFKQQAEFLGKIFLTLESRDGDLKEFFQS